MEYKRKLIRSDFFISASLHWTQERRAVMAVVLTGSESSLYRWWLIHKKHAQDRTKTWDSLENAQGLLCAGQLLSFLPVLSFPTGYMEH